MDSIEALLRLLHIPGFGAVKIKRLIDQYGSPGNAFLAESAELAKLPAWKHRKEQRTWEIDRDIAEKEGVSIVPYFAKNYPSRLLDITDPPILLYVRGKMLASDNQGIAIVGTRYATPYGMERATLYGSVFGASGVTVISGLARGIDTAAHQSSLGKGRTIAVIGSGLANVYPPENRKLADEIAERGAVMSEFPMTTPPDKKTFPQRNRIVSGMSKAVLLIEAPRKSGAMITMDLAYKQGRACWAIPGRSDVFSFDGNHELIQQGRAKLTTRPQDLLDGMADLFGDVPCKPSLDFLSGEEKRIFAAIPPEGIYLDELCGIMKLPVAKITVLLMSLILKNLIKELPGQRYQKR